MAENKNLQQGGGGGLGLTGTDLYRAQQAEKASNPRQEQSSRITSEERKLARDFADATGLPRPTNRNAVMAYVKQANRDMAAFIRSTTEGKNSTNNSNNQSAVPLSAQNNVQITTAAQVDTSPIPSSSPNNKNPLPQPFDGRTKRITICDAEKGSLDYLFYIKPPNQADATGSPEERE